MKIVFISDLHCQLDKVNLPAGDLLCVSGDFSMKGDIAQYTQFNKHLSIVKDKYTYGVLICEGNHEFLGQEQPALATELLSNAKVLRHEAVEINGVKFFGSPYTPFFYNWSFNVHRGKDIAEKWAQIPENTDILITHGPPYGVLDKTTGGENVGCKDLLEAILQRKIKIVSFGHIHSGAGFKEIDNVQYINASTCNEKYQPVNAPIIVEYDVENKKVLSCGAAGD